MTKLGHGARSYGTLPYSSIKENQPPPLTKRVLFLLITCDCLSPVPSYHGTIWTKYTVKGKIIYIILVKDGAVWCNQFGPVCKYTLFNSSAYNFLPNIFIKILHKLPIHIGVL